MTTTHNTTSPNVFIDISRLIGRALKGRLPTGVDRVGLAYLSHFQGRAGALVRTNRGNGRALVLSPDKAGHLFDAMLEAQERPRLSLVGALARAAIGASGESALAGALLFNTGHTGLEQSSYIGQLRRQKVRPVFVLHDLIPMTHPEYCRPGELAKHVRRIDNLLASATGIITNSQATLDDLERYARGTGTKIAPAVAAHLAAASLPTPSSARPLAQPYFVMTGTIEPRKNHVMILQVWRSLIARLGPAAPRLVIIGQRGWECENAVDLLERCPSLRGFVIELNRCSDRDLATWLGHAQALLFPSFAEGYGMPLAEALTARVPVLASDLPAFHEIGRDIPDYLDPLDGLGWLRLIEAYADTDAPDRRAQVQRLAAFEAPTWTAHFDAVETLMERIV